MATRPADPSGAWDASIDVDLVASEGPPDLDLFDGKLWKGAWKQANAQEDWGLNQSRYMGEAVDRIREELRKRGLQVQAPIITAAGVAARNLRGRPGRMARMEGAPEGSYPAQVNAFFDALAAAQAADPALLPEYKGIRDLEGLFQFGLRKRQADLAEAQKTLGRAGGWSRTGATLITGLGHGLTDPSSYLPLPGAGQVAGGFARQVVVNAGKLAAENAALAVAMEPLVRADAGEMGIDRTTGDTVVDVALQAGTGALIGGGVTALHGLTARAREIAAEAAFNALPESVQKRWVSAGTKTDRLAVLDLRRMVPEDQWSPELRDAVNVLERTSDIAEASPYLPGRRNDEAHLDRLADALGRTMGGGVSVKAGLRAGTSISRAPDGLAAPDVTPAGMATFMRRVRGVESGGNDLAKAATSSAFGRYQFTAPTWIRYYVRRYGRHGESDAQILARRADGHAQDQLMADLTRDNIRALRKGGHEASATNLYLLHFAGERRGLDILDAPADTPIRAVVSEAVISSNRAVLEGKTVGEVRAWAARKMGERGSPVGVAAAGGDGAAATLQAEADALRAEGARALAEFAGLPLPERGGQDGGARPDEGEADAPLPEPLPLDPEDIAAPGLSIDPQSPAPLTEAIIQSGGMAIDRGFDGQQAALADRNERNRLIAQILGLHQYDRTIGDEVVVDVARNAGDAVLPYGLIDANRGASIDALAERAVEAGVIEGGTREAQREAFVARLREELTGVDVDPVARATRLNAVAEAVDARAMQRWDADDPIWDTIDAHEVEAAMIASAQSDPQILLAELDARLFDDPDGADVKSQIESLSHDLRLIAEQEPDARYRVDEEGDEHSLHDLIAAHDEDAATVEALRGCL